MQSLRRLINKPRLDDWAPLAKFFYADEALNDIASELDSFDGRRDPERCNHLVNKLRFAQDRVLHIIGEMLITLFPRESDRACRDFRVKFPDEIVHDNLPGQLWFGAECLAAGSNIIDHEAESDNIRPLARDLTRHLDSLRELLKDQSLRDPTVYTDAIKESLIKFDHLFAEFEFKYVSAMVPVKSVQEHDSQLDVAVLFSDVLDRALQQGRLTQDQIDYCDPAVMIVIPRLAIVWGLLYFPEGALCLDGGPSRLSEMFRPFYSLLCKIRNLLIVLTPAELAAVESALCAGVDEERAVNEGAASSSAASGPLTMSDFRNSQPIQLPSSVSATAVGSREDSPESTPDATPPTSPQEEMPEEQQQSSPVPAESNPAQELRARFRSSEDLIHRLFVCVAGVADQLQTNYSSDVRKVLKIILQPNEVVPVFEVKGQTAAEPENEEETGVEVQEALPLPSFIGVRWVPDADCEQCTACQAPFTVVRRRHHCRNCGRIFCSRCSAKAIAIPELGYEKKVRVCNLCYLHRINPFSPCIHPPTSGSSAAAGTANE